MEHQKGGTIQMAALKGGMNRKTAAKYIQQGEIPSQQGTDRSWRTRKDPFAAHSTDIDGHLREAPELEAKALFEWLCERYPGVYEQGQLRTFQRYLKQWRALHGPEKEVYFAQDHRPGIRLSTDFTWANNLGITIRGEAFNHLLCHSVLSYSNWEWATICHSESFLAIREGLQAGLLRLGHVPSEHWTDHSTAATHEVCKERAFNQSYLDLMEHFGIQPRTIQVNKPHENGDVESQNGVLKRRLNQHLLLRGSRDFQNQEQYRLFLEDVVHRANGPRRERLLEELEVMKPLTASLLPAYVQERVRVSRYSTIQCERRAYSVPSRLIGEEVQVRRFVDKVEVYYAGKPQLTMPRITGEQSHAINYRHIIEWLIRKPGAFGEYRYREDLFPSLVFRRAYDRLVEAGAQRTADLEYLRILREAARTMQTEVEAVLLELEQKNMVPRWETLKAHKHQQMVEAPDIKPLEVNLAGYDALFSAAEVVS